MPDVPSVGPQDLVPSAPGGVRTVLVSVAGRWQVGDRGSGVVAVLREVVCVELHYRERNVGDIAGIRRGDHVVIVVVRNIGGDPGGVMSIARHRGGHRDQGLGRSSLGGGPSVGLPGCTGAPVIDHPLPAIPMLKGPTRVGFSGRSERSVSRSSPGGNRRGCRTAGNNLRLRSRAPT